MRLRIFGIVLCNWDVNSIGCHLTWTNGVVWSKLDRVMVNDRWIQEGREIYAHFLPEGCLSDHSPSITTIGGYNTARRRSFKFFDMWTSHDEYGSIVQQVWSTQFVGTEQYKLCRRLRVLKGPLRTLNKNHYSHISVRAEQAREELEHAQQRLHDSPTDQELQDRVRSKRKMAWDLTEAERRLYFQKAKCRYIISSDRNTKLSWISSVVAQYHRQFLSP